MMRSSTVRGRRVPVNRSAPYQDIYEDQSNLRLAISSAVEVCVTNPSPLCQEWRKSTLAMSFTNNNDSHVSI